MICRVVAEVLVIVSLASACALGSTSQAVAGPESILLKQGTDILHVSLQCPKLVFGNDGWVDQAKPGVRSGHLDSGSGLVISYAPVDLAGRRVDVKLHAKWFPKESVLRKWASFRLSGPGPALLLTEAVLEDIDTKAAGPALLAKQPPCVDGLQSYPVLLKGFFVGIEFPIAATRVEGTRLILGHRPGLRVQPGVWHETRRAVYGLAPVREEMRAFQRYINANRPKPKGREHFLYNPYWSTPITPSKKQILDIMQALEQKLWKKHRETFDSCGLTVFTTDTRSIWKVDMKRFPRGLSDLQEAAERISSHLDVFFSPSSAYPPALDPLWAREQGYETIPFGDSYWLCLGGKRYQAEAKKSIIDMVKRYKASHMFLDGYLSVCGEADHGHEPGPLSAEPIAEGIIDIMRGLREASPDIWLAPTCFTHNPSPWWSFWSNSLIGTYGDDAPYGRVPCPMYRETYTTARDFYYLQGMYWQSTPTNVQDSFGITHQSNYPLLNDAVTEVLRGGMQHQCPINPVYMNDVRWKHLAELMKWARKNVGTLQETEPLLPASWQGGKCPKLVSDAAMPREPYGYAHWQRDRGIVMLRNPWIEPQEYTLKLPSTLGPAKVSAVSLYPETRVYGRDLAPGNTVRVPLAPYETLVLSIDQRQSIRNLPEAAACHEKLSVKVTRKHVACAKLESQGDALAPGSTRLTADAATALDVRLAADVIAEADAKLLVLVEDKTAPCSPICRVRINGKEASLCTGGSQTGWAATVVAKPENWLFMSTDLPPGRSKVDLALLACGSDSVVSVWVWATKQGKADGTRHPNALPQPEIMSLDSACLLKPVSASTPGLVTLTMAAPTERIDGVFLDAIDPAGVSATNGYRVNANSGGGPLTIAGRRYPRGLGSIAPTRLGIALEGKYRRFQAYVGLDSALIANYMDRSKVSFEVWVDGEKRWESGETKIADPPDQPILADVDVSGATKLELVAVARDVDGNIAQNWVDWADAKLLR